MAKIFNSLLGVLRGGVHPREIGFAVFLGTLAGFASGWNATLAIVLLAVLVLRAPIKMFLQVWAVAAALAWMLTPATLRLGQFLLIDTPVGDWLARHQDSLWLALFPLDVYVLIGGLAMAPVIGLLAAWIISRTARAIQERFRAIHARVQACQQWEASRSVRIVCWFLFGGAERAKEPLKAPRLLRTWGVALALLILAPTIVCGWLYLPWMIEGGVLHALSMANGAEVNAKHIELSLSDGRLYVRDLQVADPDKLDQDRLRVGQLTAKLRPGPLLRGMVYVDWVLIDGVVSDTPRERQARPYQLELPEFGRGNAEDPMAGSPESGGLWDFSLSDYTQDWGQVEERLKQAKELLKQVEGLVQKHSPAETPGDSWPRTTPTRDVAVMPAYYELRSRRHAFGPPKPRVWIRQVRFAHLTPKWGLGEGATVELTELTSDPPLVGKPTRFVLTAREPNLRVEAKFNLHHPSTPHNVYFEAADVDLDKLVDTSKLSDTFAISGGKLHLFGDGTMTSRQLDLPLTVGLRDLDLRLLGQGKVAGLTPDLWNEGLQKIGAMNVQSHLVGRWLSPRLRLNTQELAAEFRQRLQAAGHLVLAQAVDQQMTRGKQFVADTVADATHQATEAVAEQTERAQAVVDRGHQRIGQQFAAAEEKADKVRRKANDAQAKAQDKADRVAQKAEGQIVHGQGLAKEWLRENTPISNLGGGGLIDQAAQGLRQQVDGGRHASTQAFENTAGAAQTPLNQTKPTSGFLQSYLNGKKDQVQAGVQQTQRGVNDRLTSGAVGTHHLTEQTAGRVKSYLPGGQATPPANPRGSVVGPYTELLPGGASTTPTTAQDHVTQRYGNRRDVPAATPPGGNPPYPITPGPGGGGATVPAYDPAGTLPYPPRGPTSPPSQTIPPTSSVPPRDTSATTAQPQYPTTPFHYPSTSSRSPSQPVSPSTPSHPPAAAPSNPGPSGGTAGLGPYQYPTTRSRPPTHARPQPETQPSPTGVKAKPPYAYEAGGQYDPAQPQQRIDQSQSLPRNPASAPVADAFPGPPLPRENRQFPPRTANVSRGAPQQPVMPQPNNGLRMTMDPGDPFVVQRRTPGAPASMRSQPQAPPPDDRWAITRWAEDTGTGVKEFFFGSSESGQLRQNQQPQFPSNPRMARQPPRNPPTYAPRRSMQQPQQQDNSQPWYRALW